jgi:hypothetical protein
MKTEYNKSEVELMRRQIIQLNERYGHYDLGRMISCSDKDDV